MKVNVTQEDINNGKRQDCQECPIALAIKRACTGSIKVWAKPLRCMIVTESVTFGTVIKRYDTPEAATVFMSDFDKNLSVQPIEFYLEPFSDAT